MKTMLPGPALVADGHLIEALDDEQNLFLLKTRPYRLTNASP